VSVIPAYSSQGNRFCVPGTFCTPSPGFPPGPVVPGVAATVNIPNSVSWTGAAGYIVYDLNDNIEFATRGEWFRDSNGARSGLRQTLGEFTETLNYKVPGVTGLLARLEYRHDESGAKPFFSNTLLPATAANVAAGRAGLPAHTYAGQDTLLAAVLYSF
jgi:Putative beta-barrel porin-2, OmpL-like. bbp2